MIKIEEVKSVLEQEKVENTKVAAVLSKLKQKEADKKADKDTEPKPKKQYVLVDMGNGFGYSVQMLEGDNPADVITKVKKVAAAFNLSRKGKKVPVKTIGETFASVPRRFFKGENLFPKHKEQVYIGKSDNKLVNN